MTISSKQKLGCRLKRVPSPKRGRPGKKVEMSGCGAKRRTLKRKRLSEKRTTPGHLLKIRPDQRMRNLRLDTNFPLVRLQKIYGDLCM